MRSDDDGAGAGGSGAVISRALRLVADVLSRGRGVFRRLVPEPGEIGEQLVAAVRLVLDGVGVRLGAFRDAIHYAFAVVEPGVEDLRQLERAGRSVRGMRRRGVRRWLGVRLLAHGDLLMAVRAGWAASLRILAGSGR